MAENVYIHNSILMWEHYSSSALKVLINLLFDSNENSEYIFYADKRRGNELIKEGLRILVNDGMIDVYESGKSFSSNRWLIVVRPSDYYMTGSNKEYNLKKVSCLYNSRRRSTNGYSKFRIAVLVRDNYTCQECGCTENLTVHHIKEYVNYPELRTTVSNGITLCQNCHKERHRKGVRWNGK